MNRVPYAALVCLLIMIRFLSAENTEPNFDDHRSPAPEVTNEKRGFFLTKSIRPTPGKRNKNLAPSKHYALKPVVESENPIDKNFPESSAPLLPIQIGELAFVNNDLGIAVVFLETKLITPDGFLISRNHGLELTAVFEVTDERSGRALGLKILYGIPKKGDEVIIPGAKHAPYLSSLGAISPEK